MNSAIGVSTSKVYFTSTVLPCGIPPAAWPIRHTRRACPGLYALFALPAAQYREADVLFVTVLPLAAAASALFALPQVTARRPRIAYTVCACLAAPALFWLFAPDTPYTTAYMTPRGRPVCCGALCYPAALCC